MVITDDNHIANVTIVDDPNELQQSHFDVVRFVYSVSGWSSLALGLPLNALLIWLILHHTISAMKMYARIMLYSCCLDVLLILVTSTVQPILIADHGYRLLIQNGIFRNIREPYALILDSIWLQLLVCFDISTTFQFVFRYLLLTRDGEISRATILKLIGMAIAGNVIHYIVMIVADWPNPEHAPLIEKMQHVLAQETGLTNVQIASFSVGGSMAWYVHAAFMIFLFFGCYATILTCVYKIRRHINKHLCELDAVEQKQRDINFQITRALIIQAILPTFELIAFSLKIFLPIAFTTETVFYIIYTAIPLYFIPVLNPVGTILSVKPYRRAIFKLFAKHKIHESTITKSHIHHKQQQHQRHKIEVVERTN